MDIVGQAASTRDLAVMCGSCVCVWRGPNNPLFERPAGRRRLGLGAPAANELELEQDGENDEPVRGEY